MSNLSLRMGALLHGRFLLERKLGSGGVGAVWLAQDQELKVPVAVKILHERFAKTPQGEMQLRREAELLSRLQHPHIARAFQLFHDEAYVFLVLEYVEGLPLDRELGLRARENRPFTTQQIGQLFCPLTEAIAYAHQEAIVHRDLKPQNIMCFYSPGGVGSKVLDFGIAKFLESSLFESTTIGRRIGSVFYMSPEQGRGEASDERSDVFALGCVLFEALSLRRIWALDARGERPLAFAAPLAESPANQIGEVVRRILTETRPQVTTYRVDLDTKWDAIVARALAIDPAERFQSMAEFGAALANIANAQPEGHTVLADVSDTYVHSAADDANETRFVHAGITPGFQSNPAMAAGTTPGFQSNPAMAAGTVDLAGLVMPDSQTGMGHQVPPAAYVFLVVAGIAIALSVLLLLVTP